MTSRRYHPSVETRLARRRTRSKLPPDSRSRMSGPAASARRASRRRDAHDGPTAARRAHLSDVEQPATADRRSQHAGRRQQPGLLADDGECPRSRCRWATRATTLCRRACRFFGRAFDEARLIKIAYDYEQATKWRQRTRVDAAARIDDVRRRKSVGTNSAGAAHRRSPRILSLPHLTIRAPPSAARAALPFAVSPTSL